MRRTISAKFDTVDFTIFDNRPIAQVRKVRPFDLTSLINLRTHAKVYIPAASHPGLWSSPLSRRVISGLDQTVSNAIGLVSGAFPRVQRLWVIVIAAGRVLRAAPPQIKHRRHCYLSIVLFIGKTWGDKKRPDKPHCPVTPTARRKSSRFLRRSHSMLKLHILTMPALADTVEYVLGYDCAVGDVASE